MHKQSSGPKVRQFYYPRVKRWESKHIYFPSLDSFEALLLALPGLVPRPTHREGELVEVFLQGRLLRAEGPAVFLAQGEALGTKCKNNLRAKGPAVLLAQGEALESKHIYFPSPDSFEAHLLPLPGLVPRPTLREGELGEVFLQGRLLRAEGPAVFLAQGEAMGIQAHLLPLPGLVPRPTLPEGG